LSAITHIVEAYGNVEACNVTATVSAGSFTGTVVATSDTTPASANQVNLKANFSGNNRIVMSTGTIYYVEMSWTTSVSAGLNTNTIAGLSNCAYYNGSTWINSNSLGLQIEGLIEYSNNKRLVTSTKALTFTPSIVDLFYSVKTPAGTGISAPQISLNGGANYIPAELVDSRTDPLDSSSTECHYSADVSAYPGTSLIIYWDLNNNSDFTATPELVRYGSQFA
jgi:hypothetical protein